MARHRAFPRAQWTIVAAVNGCLLIVSLIVALTTLRGGSPPSTTALPCQRPRWPLPCSWGR